MSVIKKIKITFPFDKTALFNQLPSNDAVINKHQFFINPKENDIIYDYWIIYENLLKPKEKTHLKNEQNTFFFTGEPPSVKRYSNSFLNQFGTIITSHTDLEHPNVLNTQQCLPWTIKKTFQDLNNNSDVKKEKFISLITSNKTITDGHKKRLDFAYKLKEYYPDHIDLYGRGINCFDDKWDILAPYKYHICIENSSFKDYFTEKITDSFLSLCFPLYYGCTNIQDYFTENSFKKIDINDIYASRKIIDMLIEDEKHYERCFSSLLNSKTKCLKSYNLFFYSMLIIKKQNLNQEPPISTYKIINQTPVDKLKYFIKSFIDK